LTQDQILMSILLTGASGFIGRYVVSSLIAKEVDFKSIGRTPPATAPLNHLHVDLATGEGLDRVQWDKIETVIHLAASGVKASGHRTWSDAVAANVNGTRHLLEAIPRSVKSILMIRTFYEDYIEQVPGFRENPYIVTKSAANNWARTWSKAKRRPVTFATVYQAFGPGDHPSSVLNYATAKIARREVAKFGSGIGKRDWIYASDVAEGVLAAACAGGETAWDLGRGELISVRQMVEAIADAADASLGLLRFDSSLDRPDTELCACARTFPPGWKPEVSLKTGIARLLADFEQSDG
jgi:UDP-glucose 4-epimerase